MAQEREPARSPRWATTAYPLNSKRLTAQVFGRIAKSLELPISAAFADLRQMVEGRLAEGDRDPRNVEVILGPRPDHLSSRRGGRLSRDIAGGRERTRRITEESVELADRRRGGRPQP